MLRPSVARSAYALLLLAGTVAACAAVACNTPATTTKPSLDPGVQDSNEFLPLDPSDEPLEPEQEQPPVELNPRERKEADAGGVDASSEDGGAQAADAGSDAGVADAGAADSGTDAGRDAGSPCTSTVPKAGDLRIVEIMLTSKLNSGDEGEWVEVLNSSACPLDINGVTVESPRGITTDIAKVANAPLLAPGAAFIVANTADSAKNNKLPGIAATWNVPDVLKNDGDTIIVRRAGTELDRFVYPKVSPTPVARSLTFPSACAPVRRANIQAWSLSFRSWTPGFLGTPAKPNDDVLCPP
jgi:Lamin Tail Domain